MRDGSAIGDGSLDVARLQDVAYAVRRRILHMAAVKRVHIGPAFSIVEILTLLYCRQLRVDASVPDWPGRDRFILSKGHGALALYGTLCEVGFVSADVLAGFGQPGSVLAGHPTCFVPGVDVATGSLGHGLSIGAGLALAARMGPHAFRTVVLMGDGELNEGSVWEAALFAGHQGLDTLVAVVDRNGYQQEGPTAHILDTEPLVEKWRAFGWHVISVDGHRFDALAAAFDQAEAERGRPTIVIAKTVKGRGISFMEHSAAWHMGWLEGEQFEQALRVLEQERAR